MLRKIKVNQDGQIVFDSFGTLDKMKRKVCSEWYVSDLHDDSCEECKKLNKENIIMSLQNKLYEDIKVAMKAKDALKLQVIRMAMTLITNKEKANKKVGLTDTEVTAILNTMIKQRKDSDEQFRNAGRIELADKEVAEIKIIESYLPKEATEAQTKIFVIQAGHNNELKIGPILKAAKVLAEASGYRVDGKVLSTLTNEFIKEQEGKTN